MTRLLSLLLSGCIFWTGMVASCLAQDPADSSKPAGDAPPRQSEPAGDKPAADGPESEQADRFKDGFQLQSLDDPAFPLEPVAPRSEATQKELDSHAWFMTGRLLQRRESYRRSLAAYEKAVQLNPDNPAIYRAIIDVAMHLRDTQRVMDAAMKVVELDPDDFELLRQIGINMLRQEKLDQAVEYLEKARNSPRLRDKNGFLVIINRDLAILYSGLGQNEKAADCYEVVLAALLNPAEYGLNSQTVSELQKNRATSFERIGQALLLANRSDQALKALEKAIQERSGQTGGVNYLLAQLYSQKKEYEKALAQLDLFFESKTDRGPGPYALLKSVMTELGQADGVIGRLELLAENNPRNSELQFYLAEAYVEVERLQDAEKLYLKSLEQAPSREAWLGLARIYRQLGRSRELLDNLAQAQPESGAPTDRYDVEKQAVIADEKLLEELFEIGRSDTKKGAAAEHFKRIILLAELAEEAEKTDQAVEFYQLALEASPADAGRTYEGLGRVLMAADRYAEAAAWYQKAVDNPLLQGIKPNNLLMLAIALEMAGQTDDALVAIRQANDSIPNGHPLLAVRECWIYYHAQRLAEAVEKYEAFLQKYPGDDTYTRQAKFSLSAIHVQRGDKRKGEEILEKFLADHPDDPGVNNDLGYLYAEQGKNLEQARSMIEKAVAAEPDNAAYLDSMGWVLYQLGDFKGAADWLQKATAKDNGEDSTIWNHLGDCHIKLKDIDSARSAWNKALELEKKDGHPDEELVKKIEEKLRIHTSEAGKTQTDKQG